ncbi:hypothetical protein [Pedobacter alpinus]|uniref:HTH cro/C1-type domain-containing protein n=1 Tax=Pedobacter alpinus TaxID=1590643 RepID=A0ABW5TSM8_9SPHI
MSLHIGSEIKKVFDDSGMKVQAFADKINYSRQNVNGIFKRSSLDTDLLIKISTVLNHDFFSHYKLDLNFFEEPSEDYKIIKKESGYSISVMINVNDAKKGKEILELIGLK